MFTVQGRTIYVGQTFLLRTRMLQHDCQMSYSPNWWHTKWGQYEHLRCRVKYARKYGESLMDEARLIRKLQPEFNIRGKKK